MGSKNAKAQAAERRARIAEMRKAEQARERRNRILTLVTVAVVVLATAGGGVLLWRAAEDEQQARDEAKAAPVKGAKTWDDLSQDHVEGEVDYPMSPAAGGEHSQTWATCDAQVYDEEINDENAVHSLEHGAVWITYNDKAAKGDVEKLKDTVKSTPYSFVSPYPDQKSPIALTAWGVQLSVDKASDKRVRQFLDTYVQGEQTPEKGATCSGGTMP
ncbi:DUF3105 domain-containing protein [Streptomyces sp. MAR4 CNX-425]|uniref:DUF3105 domain-containing protein n=1 Tax=Streptomyces sp. MAR4 CNX-425 TaxID=3406343 RepID=UPI003B50266A